MRDRVRGLDGLRAVAVVSVMLFHCDLGWARGGFLGVDLFFVVSGFIITALLLREQDSSGRIKLRAFYARRARRLLPALALVAAATVTLAGLVVTDAAADLRADLPWAAGFLLNWHYIASDHSYFATMARPPLLQHLWSLAIEEQFYIVWPALLIVLTRLRSSLLETRYLVAAVSMGAAALSAAHMATLATQLGVPAATDPMRVYFGTDTHAFGLLIGCALAALRHQRADQPAPAHSARSWVAGYAALAVVVTALSQVDGSTPWLYQGGMVGFALAAAAVIEAASRPGFASILTWRSVEWVGQRSYGMYLWHWPVFTLVRPGVDTAWPDPVVHVVRLTVVVALSALSFRLVEQPLRHRTLRWPAYEPRRVAAAALSLALLASGAAGVATASPAQSVSLASAGTFAEAADDMMGDGAQDVLPVKGNVRPAYRRTVVFGDSVVLSGRVALRATLGNIAIDAKVGRQPSEIARHIVARKSRGKIGSDVVIHMGTNGTVTEDDLQPILDLLRDRRRVVVVNVRVPRAWMRPSNAVISRLISRYPNVRLADWDTVGRGHRAYFTPDGVHLTARGGRAFARMVDEALRRA